MSSHEYPRNQIDLQFLVSERGPQGAGQVKVAAAGLRIDIGRAASAIAPVGAKQTVADPDVAAYRF